MNFSEIGPHSTIFIDANTLVYAFAPDPQLGSSCIELLERIEHRELQGYTSTHVLADASHRLMSLEACATFGWPYKGIATRMKRHPTQVQQLTSYRQAIDAVFAMGVLVLSSASRHVSAAGAVTRQTGLLTNDALIVVLMQENGVAQLASHDADFDRVAGLTRFSPSA